MSTTPKTLQDWQDWLWTNKTHVLTVVFSVAMALAKYAWHADPSTLAMMVGIGTTLGLSAHKSDHAQTKRIQARRPGGGT